MVVQHGRDVRLGSHEQGAPTQPGIAGVQATKFIDAAVEADIEGTGSMSLDALNKTVSSIEEAIADVGDQSSIMVGGFGGPGFPSELVGALARKRVQNISIVCNNADFGCLMYQGGLRKLTCSYPVGPTSKPVLDAIENGDVELEIVPQGTLTERIRAGGAGLGGVLTPTGVDAEFGAGYDVVERQERRYVLAPAMRTDYAFVKASVADRWGNLVFRHASRNFNPVMAMAGDVTVVQAETVLEPGQLDPDRIHTPSVFVDRVVLVRAEA